MILGHRTPARQGETIIQLVFQRADKNTQKKKTKIFCSQRYTKILNSKHFIYIIKQLNPKQPIFTDNNILFSTKYSKRAFLISKNLLDHKHLLAAIDNVSL
jgi:hypothetical protein